MAKLCARGAVHRETAMMISRRKPAQLLHQKYDAAAGHLGGVEVDHQPVGDIAQQKGEVTLGGVYGDDCQRREGGPQRRGTI